MNKVSLERKLPGVPGEFGRIPGELPHFVAIDSTGATYSADLRNWRIDKFVKE